MVVRMSGLSIKRFISDSLSTRCSFLSSFGNGTPQAQLAQIIGISQNTLSFYEREAGDIPARLVPPLAKALGVSLEEVLGVNQSAAKKRGPKSQLERQLETVADLPRSTQRKIRDVLNDLIAQRKAAS